MNLLKRLFARPSPSGTVNDGSVPGAQVGLYSEEATSQLVRMMMRLPDLDEVLKQAGIRRERLRVMLYDDEIMQACETRLDALLATPVRFEPSETAQSMLLETVVRPVIRDLVSAAWKARLYGYSVAEAVYHLREDGVVAFAYVGEKPLNWFEPKPDGSLRYFPDDGSGGSDGIEVDQRYKFFLTRNNATYINPYGEALLSRLYWPWYFRTNGWKFWAKFLERFGTPLLVGKSTDPQAMVTALLLAHQQSVIAVDRDDDVGTAGLLPGANGQAFEAFETATIRRIQKVILGQTLTSGTDGGSGNRALGDVHDTVRIDKRNSDIVLVMPTVQRLVDAVCELNGWERHEVIFADEVGLETNRAQRDKELYAVGVRFTRDYLEDNYDLRETDFTLDSEATGAGTSPTEPQGGAGAPSPANPGARAEAARAPSHLFTRRTAAPRFTRQQKVVEEQAEAVLATSGQPLDPELVLAAVLAATSPEDLADRLFALTDESVSADQFQATLERALYAADVLGYVHAEGKV